MSIRWLFALVLAFALALPQFGRATAAPAFSHIYVIMEENTNYEDVVGNTADAPYINSLIQQDGFAANYYGVTHTSVPNYIALLAGDIFGSHKDDASQRFDQTNLVDQLESKGLTWATYQENLPSVGADIDQDPPKGTGLYVRKHDPFMMFTDILNNPTRLQNVKPMDALATDLDSGKAPNFAFIEPNNCHNMHGVSPPSSTMYNLPWCAYPPDFVVAHATIQAADAYAKQLITTIMSSKGWTSDSVIVLTWDENESSGRPLSGPNRGYASSTGCCASPPGDGGGRVPTIVITSTPLHTVSLHPYNHYSLLRTIEDNWGLPCLRNACDPSVQAMTDLIPTGAGGTAVPLDQAQGFAVTFYSKNPGQGWVLFGPSCSALVETATRDITAGTTTHTVFVTGNDLLGTVGNIGLSPGVDYYYETVTITASGLEVDNNNGNCYVQTISHP